jgi:hypothetical protein
LLAATLQAIAPVTVPALQGDTIPLLADTGATNRADVHRHLQQSRYRRFDRNGSVLDARRFV